MEKSKSKTITVKCIYFDPYPKYKRQNFDENTPWDRLFDGLADAFWCDSLFYHYISTGISARNGIMCVSWTAWWVPGWTMRRKVATIAARQNVGGTATFVVERSVLE